MLLTVPVDNILGNEDAKRQCMFWLIAARVASCTFETLFWHCRTLGVASMFSIAGNK